MKRTKSNKLVNPDSQIFKFKVSLKYVSVTFASLIIFTNLLIGQETEWIHQFGTLGVMSDYANAVDTDGNVYVAGFTDGGDNSLNYAFVCKYDANGFKIWNRKFEANDIKSIQVGTSGVYIAGIINGALPDQTSKGGLDAFIRKYDHDGNELWTCQFGTSLHDYANGITIVNNSVYVAGYSFMYNQGYVAFLWKFDGNGNEDWNSEIGTLSLSVRGFGVSGDASGVYVTGDLTGALPGQTYYGRIDGFVCKFDHDGNELWIRQFGTYRDDLTYGIDVDVTGVYVAGNFGYHYYIKKYDHDGSELWTRQVDTNYASTCTGVTVDATGVYLVGWNSDNVNNRDVIVAKYDHDGNIKWFDQFGSGERHSDVGTGISTDATGIYIVGWVTGILPDQTNPGSVTNSDAFLRKYDPSGNELWTRQFGFLLPATDTGVGVDRDTDGNIYIAGNVTGSLPDQNNMPPYINAEYAYVRKYDPNSNELWTRQFGRVYLPIAQNNGITIDATGVYIVGYAVDILPSQNPSGEGNAFIRKYDYEGNELWTRQFETGNNGGLFTDSFDNISFYVAGNSIGTLPSQNPSGQGPLFVRKYDINGNELWTHQFGGSMDKLSDISVNESGVYLTGTIRTNPYESWDVFISKYDHDGNYVWYQRFGSNDYDVSMAISVDVTGIYVVGFTRGTFPGQPTYHSNFIRKYDFDGSELWTRQFGKQATTSKHEGPTSVIADTTVIYVTGWTDFILPGQIGYGGRDAYITAFAPNGNELWMHQFGTTGHETAYDITVDESAIYIGGAMGGGLFPDQTDINLGGTDAFLIKFQIPNVPPIVDNINAPMDPVLISTTIDISAEFMDPNREDVHTALWDWGDGTTSSGTVNEENGAGTVTGTHDYTTPGVYTVTITVTDDDGAPCDSYYQYVVVYDPSTGFVTGAGWIESPEGAYVPDPSLTGKAIFGFVSKYLQGATTPSGNTKFKFRIADLNFKSTIYDWMVIAGARAKYKGTGTINDVGNYGFMLSAIDGDINGGGGDDKFRIKIWDKDNGDVVVYDNQSEASDDADATTLLGAGNIKIHKDSNLNKPLRPMQIESALVPKEYSLSQNYPNPFNPTTTIRFDLPKASQVQLIIYNTLGQKIRQLVDDLCAEGVYSVYWDGLDEFENTVTAGIYFYQIHAEGFVTTKKMILAK